MEAVDVALEVAVHKLIDKVDRQIHACETAQTPDQRPLAAHSGRALVQTASMKSKHGLERELAGIEHEGAPEMSRPALRPTAAWMMQSVKGMPRPVSRTLGMRLFPGSPYSSRLPWCMPRRRQCACALLKRTVAAVRCRI